MEAAVWKSLVARIASLPGAVVAFSGGTDSALVLRAAVEALPAGQVLGVTAVSETYLPEELESAVGTADAMGAPHMVVETEELSNPDFANNPVDRCYYCKSELFSKLKDVAAAKADGGDRWIILDGSNADDENDHRPGRVAAAEAGVISPLAELGIGKQAVRAVSRDLGLATWDKPSAACLASRFPYGEGIDKGGLQRVANAERLLRRLGLSQLRVRDYGNMARIEIDRSELEAEGLLSRLMRDDIVGYLKGLGYRYVTLDLEGYRSGSMNEVLEGR